MKKIFVLLFIMLSVTQSAYGARYCQGGLFKPCVCPSDVTKDVQYYPTLRECGGNAGIVTRNAYAYAFSVVVRDNQNRDRWPSKTLINGCTPAERDAGLAKCSVFKVQKTKWKVMPFHKLNRKKQIVGTENVRAKINCLGASGRSALFKNVTRMTFKMKPSGAENIVRLCIASPRKKQNVPTEK